MQRLLADSHTDTKASFLFGGKKPHNCQSKPLLVTLPDVPVGHIVSPLEETMACIEYIFNPMMSHAINITNNPAYSRLVAYGWSHVRQLDLTFKPETWTLNSCVTAPWLNIDLIKVSGLLLSYVCGYLLSKVPKQHQGLLCYCLCFMEMCYKIFNPAHWILWRLICAVCFPDEISKLCLNNVFSVRNLQS